MRIDPFAADAGLLTQEELQYIDTTVLETYRYVLQGRKFFPIRKIGNGDGGAQFYRHYDEQDPSEAVIDMTGKGQSDDHPEKTPHDIPVAVIHKEFFLNWRDIASSRTQGPSVLDDSIRTAARKVAEAEDRLLISGECTTWGALGLDGLFGATNKLSGASAGDWPANALEDINAGRAALQAAGFVGLEPVLIAQPALVKCLDNWVTNTTDSYRYGLLKNDQLSDVIESSNAYNETCGTNSVLLVVPGEGNFWAVQDMELETHLWYDKSQNVYGTVRETIAPVIGRPESIYEITSVTCNP